MSALPKPRLVYLDHDREAKFHAVRRELSRRVGVEIGVSDVFRRAIDDLFLAVCPVEKTIDIQGGQTEDRAA